MDSLETVAAIAATEGLRFLLVGGSAMLLHGSDRITADLDIAIRETDAPTWKARLTAAGFSEFHQTDAFIRFRPPSPKQFPVDLVIADAGTFEKLWHRARPATLAASRVQVPHPEHLMAMKIHALRYGGEHRQSKDFADILTLMRICQIGPDDPVFRETLKRYGTPEIEERIRRATRG
ncbi:MAG: nucleotidyl transferase AbiEii/AbiGii toxin family protein [Verrucomicrobiae bacterium]|nr:nucleotidyl transferase AbiEii/AbiGii toxin family protein [Verrucomicrobiae bacterium]